MGALHEGHLSLIHAAHKRCDRVVVSLFVNPTQFGPNEDYGRYPRDPDGDAALCRRAGVAILFTPTVGAIYPKDHQTAITVKPLGEVLEGASRPGHFSGVATVVTKLLQIVRPHQAFFGEKDYQQTLVIKRVAANLIFPVKIVVCPTVRESDGLAMSSRNRTLSAEGRKAATVLFDALQQAEEQIRQGERGAAAVRDAMTRLIRQRPLAQIDYVAIVHPKTLEKVSRIEGPVVLLLAVWIGKTRLIDNLTVKPGSPR